MPELSKLDVLASDIADAVQNIIGAGDLEAREKLVAAIRQKLQEAQPPS